MQGFGNCGVGASERVTRERFSAGLNVPKPIWTLHNFVNRFIKSPRS